MKREKQITRRTTARSQQKNIPNLIKPSKIFTIARAAVFALGGIAMLAFTWAWFVGPSFPWDAPPESEVLGVTFPYEGIDSFRHHCTYRGTVGEGQLCGEYQSANLFPEDSSFEVGTGSVFDGLSINKRMHYDFYNPGSGEMFSSDPAVGFVPPVITSEDAIHGSRSLKIDNKKADGGIVAFQSLAVPTSGRYVFSVYAKALSVGGAVDSDDTCANTALSLRLRIYQEDYVEVTDSQQYSFMPSEGWKRISISTLSGSPLQPGELYRAELALSNTEQPQCFGKGVVLIDAAQFEYAQNQSSPSPSAYVYPTTQQELFAYTSTDSAGQNPKTGNFFFLDDAETVYGNVQIREVAALPAGAKIKWWLYDTSGDFYNTATAISSGNISVSHNASNFQTVTQDISAILVAADPTKTKGLYAVRYELWDSGETKMYDAEHMIFGLVERSPYADQDRPDSFFANHIWLTLHFINAAYDHHGMTATRPLGEYLDLARDLGIKSSREFGLISRDNIEQSVDEDPFFDDYISALAERHIGVMPVLPGTGNVSQGWQDFVASAMEHYGDAINEYEVLNEPNEMSVETYYEFLWRAREAAQEHSDTIPNRVFGPSRGNDWLTDLLAYDDGTHGTGYSLFNGIAPHHYDRYQHGFRQIPEDGSGTGRTDIDDGIATLLAQLEGAAPGGVNTKPIWNSEFGINQSRLYPDIPLVFGVPSWGGDSEVNHWPHMSGSLFMARKLAADAIRVNLYLMANGIERGFQFGLFTPFINDGSGYNFFDFDNTPNMLAVAYPQMTTLLEGSTYVRRIEAPALRTNGVLDSRSRAFVFEAPDLENPGQVRPVVTVFNYDQDATGAMLDDIPIHTDDVEILDMEGNPISVAPGATFDVAIDMAPIYLVGQNGLTMEEMVTALDQDRPSAPAKPVATRGADDKVNITITEVADEDVASYNVYRKLQGGAEAFAGSVDAGEGANAVFTDYPSTGTWEYRATAVELGGYESEYSAYANPLQFSYRPVLAAVGNKQGAEGQELVFTVSATDIDSPSLTFTIFNGPPGHSFTDNGNKTATFRWTPTHLQAGAYPMISFSVSDGLTTDPEVITINVSNTNRLPAIPAISDKLINETELIEFMIVATDEDGDDTLTLLAENLPSGASFEDNGDETGTFRWQPTVNQAGVYDQIRFIARDNHNGQGTRTVKITVLDGIEGCSPDWTCGGWSVCANSLQTRACTDRNACGSDSGRPSEARACDSTAPGRINDLVPGQ